MTDLVQLLLDLGMSLEMAEDAQTAVSLDPQDLQSEFVNHTATYALWATRAVDASIKAARAKAHRDRVHARLYQEIREGVLDASGKRLTEAGIEAMIESSADYQTALSMEQEATEFSKVLHAIVEPLRGKKDMIVGLGANYRAELGADPSLKQR